MSSSNNNLLISSVFTVGFIVGGIVARFVSINNNHHNIKDSRHRIFLIGDIENDQEKEIDDDDVTVVNYGHYHKKSSFSHHSSSSSISSLRSSFSSISNFLTPSDTSNSLTSIYELISELNQRQKNLYKKQQALYSDTISFNHRYTCLLTETNVFKDYSCFQITKSNEKLDFLRNKIKSSFSKGVSTSEINKSVKMQMAEMRWLENFNQLYKEKLDNFIKDLEEMKSRFNEYKQRTLREVEDLKVKIEELKYEIEMCEDEETIKGIREKFKIVDLTSLLFEK